jgi:hypothetical protein
MVGDDFRAAIDDRGEIFSYFLDSQCFQNDFQANAVDVAAGNSDGYVVHYFGMMNDE